MDIQALWPCTVYCESSIMEKEVPKCVSLILVVQQIILQHNGFIQQAFIISHNFWESGFWEWLSWVVPAQSCSWGCSDLKASLGLKNPLPKWLLAGGLSSLSHAPFPGLLGHFHKTGAASSQSRWAKRKNKKDVAMPFWPGHTLSLPPCFIH